MYLAKATSLRGGWRRPKGLPPHPIVSFLRASLVDESGVAIDLLPHNANIIIEVACEERQTRAPWVLRLSVYDRQGHELLLSQDIEAAGQRLPHPSETLIARCRFPASLLKPGVYSIGASACELAGDTAVALYEEHEPMFAFEVTAQGFGGYIGRGLIGAKADWSFRWLKCSAAGETNGGVADDQSP
jgi:hypothetical protein